MSNAPKRQGIDWVAISIGCSVMVLLVAALVAMGLVYAVVSTQSDVTVDVTPLAAIELEAVASPTPTASPTPLPTEPVLAIVTATPMPSPTLPPTEVAPTETPSPLLPDGRDIRGDIPPSIIQQSVAQIDRANLEKLWTLDLPPYDYYAVAQQYGDNVGERTITRPAPVLGEVRDFLVDGRTVSAELVAITENVYHWTETSYVFSSVMMQTVAETIENDIYSTVTGLFGQEWKPGVDNDPHFSILHLESIDTFDEIGFFNSVNQYPATLDDASNQQEIVFLNMDQLELGSDLYYATVAHEIQHLIQWNLDHNETVWLNEGMAQLAEAYLGYQTSETLDYLNDTALQLNNWGYEGDVIYRHYAASYLFATYFWEQLGDDAVRDLSNSPLNGLASVRAVLQKYRPDLSIEQFMADWALANLLDDEGADGRYGYNSFRIAFPDKHERIRSFPWESVKLIPQYGVHYLDIRESGTYSITFAGDSTAPLLPSAPPSGEHVWFSPASNDVAASLTRQFDLRQATAATLEFTAWYDLERDFDFAYVGVSVDEGETWRVLTPENASPGIYGTALTGRSAAISTVDDGWITERVSLGDYIGREILVRFHVLNDGAFSKRGFALSSIGVPEINYLSTADERPDDWTSNGFVVVGTNLPQQWSVQMVQGQSIRPILLDPMNRASWVVSADSQGATIIIMPQTPWIDDMATYWLKVENAVPVSP